MDEVKVKVAALRERVQHNRDQHRAVFEKALEVYKERLLAHLELKVEQVKKGERIEHYIALPVPEDHTKDYDRILNMLDLSVDDEVTITQREFAMYVMDDWAWKESFYSNTVSYTEGH
jgi:hypothetical protein